jgi:hypothetical protein
MIIRVNDKVQVRVPGSGGRLIEVTITKMQVTTHPDLDPAGRMGKSIEKFDLDVDWSGSIDFIDEDGNPRWAYFHQIKNDNEG